MKWLLRLLMIMIAVYSMRQLHAMGDVWQGYLPPVNQAAQHAVHRDISCAPDEAVYELHSAVDINGLIERARKNTGSRPEQAIKDYLHAACLAEEKKEKRKPGLFLQQAMQLAYKAPAVSHDYVCAAIKSSLHKAWSCLGSLYASQHKFDEAEYAFRIRDCVNSTFLAGCMFDKEQHNEIKARAYYLAAGGQGMIKGYCEFATMMVQHVRHLVEQGCTDMELLQHYIDDAIDGYLIAAYGGDRASMKMFLDFVDYVERTLKYVVPPQEIIFVYNQLLARTYDPVMYQNYLQFCQTHDGIEFMPLCYEDIIAIQKNLDADTLYIVQQVETLRNAINAGDPSASYELAERLYWSTNQSQENRIEAIRAYVSAYESGSDDVKDTVFQRFKDIAQNPNDWAIHAELFFWVIGNTNELMLEKLFGFALDLERMLPGSIIEHIAGHYRDRLQSLVNQGKPLALYVWAIIRHHQALRLSEMCQEQRCLYHEVRNLCMQAYQGGVICAINLLGDVSCKLAEFYRHAGDYERAYSLLDFIMRESISVQSGIAHEYLSLCFENPEYLQTNCFRTLHKLCCMRAEDYRARCCALYISLLLPDPDGYRITEMYEYVKSILNNDEIRTYFFKKCPSFVHKALLAAAEQHNEQACYLASLLLFLTNGSDDRACIFIQQCGDANDPWVQGMTVAFMQKCKNGDGVHEGITRSYINLLGSPVAHIQEYAYGALRELARAGSVSSCCEAFLTACRRHETATVQEMFGLVKNTVISSDKVLDYLRDNAEDRLQLVASDTMQASYLMGLLQGRRADQLMAQNLPWASAAQCAFDNFVRAHYAGYACDKKILLLGCYLIDYYEQCGDATRAQAIKDNVYQLCSRDTISTFLLDAVIKKKSAINATGTMLKLLNEQAFAGNKAALEFMGLALCQGKILPSGYAIKQDERTALLHLTSLLEQTPDNYQACYQAGTLLMNMHDESDECMRQQIVNLLQKATSVGIADAERLLCIYKVRTGLTKPEEETYMRACLKKYADTGDELCNQLLKKGMTRAVEQERTKLIQTIQSPKASADEIERAIACLNNLAAEDAASQWFLIVFYMQKQMLPSGYVHEQDDLEAYRLLADYMSKQKPTLQAYCNMIRLLVDMAGVTSENDNFKRAYELVQRVKEYSHVCLDCDECYTFALACYKTCHYQEALMWLSTVSGYRNVCWLRALCYMLDTELGEKGLELMLHELTKALAFESGGNVPGVESFIDTDLLLKHLKELLDQDVASMYRPRIIALLCRMTIFYDKQLLAEHSLRLLEEASKADCSAQSLLGYIYRVGVGVPVNHEKAVDALYEAFYNKAPEPVELEDEVAAQAGIMMSMLPDSESLSLPVYAIKKLLRMVYTTIQGLIKEKPDVAITYYGLAEQICLANFMDDSEAMEFYRTSGAYDAVLQAVRNHDLFASVMLTTCECTRYLKEKIEWLSGLVEKQGNKEKMAVFESYVQQQGKDVLSVISLFDNLVQDKKLVKKFTREPVQREQLASAFDYIGRALYNINEPFDRVISYFLRALTLKPNEWPIIKNAVDIYFETGSNSLVQKGIALLEKAAGQGCAEAGLALGCLFAPGISCFSAPVEKDVMRALRCFVLADSHGSAEARSFLGRANLLTLDVRPLYIEKGSAQIRAEHMYGEARELIRKGDFDAALKILSQLIRRKMAAAAVQAATIYVVAKHDYKEACTMLLEAIKISHGLFPVGSPADMIEDIMKAMEESSDKAQQEYARVLREALINERIRSCNKH